MENVTLVNGVISALAVLIAGVVASVATYFAASKNFTTLSKQISLQRAERLAVFRQAWLNDLRNTMAEFQSYGVTPDLEASKIKDFYQTGTKIELLMNPDDPDYETLKNTLYAFLGAKTVEEKYMANPKFVETSQRILKREWDRLKVDLQEE